MKRIQTSFFLIAAIMSAFWAYTIISSLVREFQVKATTIDLGAVFVLGLISGIFFGLSIAFNWKRSDEPAQ
jgi:hypothetical protein